MAMSINTYYTKLTILSGCLIKDGYYIDNIESFFQSYTPANKIEYGKGIFVDFTKGEELEYKIPADISDFNALQYYNYAKIDFYEPQESEEENPVKCQTLYFFVSHIEFIGSGKTDGVISLHLVTDFLNSYRNYTFNRETFIYRKHCDRWNASTLTLKNGYYYVLKNIYLDDNINDDFNYFLNTSNIYPEDESNIKTKNYWIKIIFKANEGLQTFYCNFNRSYNTNYQIDRDDHGRPIMAKIESFRDLQIKDPDLSFDHLTVLLNNPNVLGIYLIPYPPHNSLTNIDENDTINPDANLFDYYKLTLNSQGQDYVYYFISTTITKYLDYTDNDINLNVLDNNLTINQILKNILIYDVRQEDLIQLKNSEITAEGFFQNNGYNFDVNNFYHLNEPSLLSSKLLNLTFTMNGTDFLLIQENIHYLRNFSQSLNNDILKFSVAETKGIKNSLVFKIKPTNYYKYLSNLNLMTYLVEYRLPQFSNSYYDYDNREKIESIKNDRERIQKQQEIREAMGVKKDDSLLTRLLKMGGEIAGNLVNDTIYYAKKSWNYLTGNKEGGKLLRGAMSLLLGRPLGVVSAAASFMYEQEKQNALNVMNIGDYETLLLNDIEYKIKLEIKQSKNLDFYHNLLYLHGNSYNKCEVPTHNSRKHFDFLQCDPKFYAINYDLDITNKIIDAYRTGVTFIHNNNNIWIFPEWHPENVELSLMNAI